MAHIYKCQLELHDSLYYATREIGRLYETEPILHNYALAYALGLVDSERHGTQVPPEQGYHYFCAEQVPRYEAHLAPLNRQGIYVTPARALNHTAVLHTWKYANNNYHVEMEKTQKNIPSFGRAKEIATESIFEFFVISTAPLVLPRWVRLGKWLSKAMVSRVEHEAQPSPNPQNFTCSHPLNPLDVMFQHQVFAYDVLNMPPVSLIQNVQLRGHYYNLDGFKLPAQMQFRFQLS
ncbi:type I-D CRISPR-associated protein Cas5/Csc1 [Candidatus Cyanaurora vandensis]|uniref:type I-D CRISPR-associated protein Cas5/Csc1 n=1 Tax=Candidatus Cyanaurora vandensis TaxID=2714958 RepID=UPI00257EA5A2|nr:type I-D CRISPR-associated protein Cas5/Csc1 [Candidatus Cyanaurora vandensis]